MDGARSQPGIPRSMIGSSGNGDVNFDTKMRRVFSGEREPELSGPPYSRLAGSRKNDLHSPLGSRRPELAPAADAELVIEFPVHLLHRPALILIRPAPRRVDSSGGNRQARSVREPPGLWSCSSPPSSRDSA